MAVISNTNAHRHGYTTPDPARLSPSKQVEDDSFNDGFSVVEYRGSLLSSHENATAAEPSAGFGAWLMRLIDRLIGVFGQKLTPTALNASLTSICESNKWSTYGSAATGGEYQTNTKGVAQFHYKQVGDTTYVMMPTAHDLKDSDNDAKKMQAGGKSISDVLNTVQNNLDKLPSSANFKILIPVAQANDVGPFGQRGHFVLLEVDATYKGKYENKKTAVGAGREVIYETKNKIDKDEKKIEISKATLHDPKGGLLDYAYDGMTHVTQRLAETGMLNGHFSSNVEYQGQQSLLNGNDCGRFTAYYAHEIAENGSLTKSSRESAVDFFNTNFKTDKA